MERYPIFCLDIFLISTLTIESSRLSELCLIHIIYYMQTQLQNPTPIVFHQSEFLSKQQSQLRQSV